MASFFQPPTGDDPTIVACNGSSAYQVYCNSVVPASERIAGAWQYFNLAVIGVGSGLPLLVLVVKGLMSLARIWKDRASNVQSRLPVASVAHLPTPKALLEASAFHVCPDGTESSVCHLCGGVSQTLCIRSLNLLVGAPSEAGAAEEKAVTLGQSNPVIATVDVSFFDINPASVDSPGAAVTHLATLLRTGGVCAIGLRIPSSSRRSIADDGEAADGEADDDVLATAAHLTEILHLLHRACIPVVVIGALDGPDGDGRPPVLAHIDLALLCGLVVVDATVLPTGERRSYFESENLRTTMARVVAEREARQGGFFVGFWETAGPHSGGATPEAAVVRRARKLAEHWSALVFFESSGGDGSCATSAFSFLRRTDVCELQEAWLRGARPVDVQIAPERPEERDETEAFALEEAARAIPDIGVLLCPQHLPQELEALRAGQPSEPPRPKCDVDSKPGQSAFEDPFAVPTVSSEGSSLDSGAARKLPTLVRAHYPLTSLLTQEDLSNVVKTQTHLRSLGMLHVCADHELQSGFIAPLRRLVSSPLPRITSPAPRPSPTRMRMLELTVSLVDGLVSGRVRIFKGLHAGFRIPDSDAWFWGLATTRSAQDDENDAAGRRRDIRWSSTSTLSTSKSSASTSTEQQKESKAESRIDIFVSLKAPSAIATVLHAWLSYHDVARLDCWDAEQRLETVEAAGRDKGNSATELVLPLSLRHELQNATYVELLALLHRFRCTPKGPASPGDEMRQAVIDLASHLLLETTTQKAWVRLHSYSYLIGETSIRDVLSSRLRMLARQGARTLPELDNLIKLHAAIEQALSTALVRGDDSVPNVLLATLQTLHSSGLTSSDSSVVFLTPQSDLLTLLVLLPLRRLALFEIFLEATDRCPIFPDTGIVSGSRGIAEGSDSGDAATGPDQAAVFTELWVLGSQCEPYFGVQPREVGEAVWRLWRAEQGRMRVRCGGRWPGSSLTMARGELMGMYVTKDVSPGPAGGGQAEKATTESVSWKRVLHEKLVSFGSMSIFCVPATLDVVLLTFAGRGLFMSAYMQREHLVAAVYALLISLLVSSGVVGWSASGVGSYLDAYAYNNMMYFHVQRLAGGLVVSLVVSLGGLVGFTLRSGNVIIGLVFAAYAMMVSNYLNLLGIMASMHQPASPLTSGRTVLWRTMPVLFIAPILSTLVNRWELAIYLPVTYGFLIIAFVQYRRLCREWATWTTRIPSITEEDILAWYGTKLAAESSTQLAPREDLAERDDSSLEQTSQGPADLKQAVSAFRAAVHLYARIGVKIPLLQNDPVVVRVAKGMPYAEWLLKKECRGTGALPEPFSATWFSTLRSATKKQAEMTMGLKEHSTLMLWRQSKYDIAQNVALFLICLCDRWVSIIMESFTSSLPPEQQPTVFTDHRVRYALCFSIVFFCLVVMVLDATLQSFWGDRFKRSNEKLMGGVEHARAVARDWEVRRRRRYLQALARLVISVLPILSLTTLLVYLMVSSPQTMLLYYLYVVGYGSVAFFQLNRCFTTSVERHMGGLYVAAVCGLTVGCVLRVLPPTRGWMYGDVVGMDTAAVLAWVFTCVSAWKDWDARGNKDQRGDIDGDPKTPIFIQRRYLSVTDEDSEDADDDQVNRGIHDPRMLSNITGHRVAAGDGSLLSMRISSLLNQCCANGDNYESSVAREAVRRSAQMWVSNLIHLVYSTTTAFADLRLEEICSFSTLDGNTGRLVITVGMLDATEAAADDWQPVLAILAVECILYHVSVAVFRHPYARALQAEHAAVAAATSRAANTPFARQLSQRLQLELARPTLPPLLSLALANSGARLLRRLCLTPVSVCWANFDYEWSTMPESVRAAIVCRVRGLPWSADSEMSGWLVDHGVDLDEWNWHAEIATTVVHMLEDRARALERNGVEVPRRRIGALLGEKDEAEQTSLYVGRHRQRSRMNPLGSIFAIPPTIVKWIAILSSASPDMERELWYLLSSPSWIAAALRTPLLFMLLTIHRFCRPLRDALIFIVLVCHHPRLKKLRRLATKGEIRKIRVGGTGDTRIMAEIGRRVVTGFAGVGAGGHEEVGKEQVGEVQSPLVLDIFDTTSMSLDMRPTNESAKPEASCRYDAQFRLRTRTDFSAAASGSRAGAVSTYHYLPESNGRWPVAKELRDAATRFLGYYDSAGRITHGTLTLGNSREYLFRYRYQETVKGKASGADGGEVLVAEYRRVSPLSSDADPAHRDTDSLTVVWGIPPLRPGGSGRRHVRSWVPSDRISRIVRVVSGQRYITTATYSHCRDPIISTVRIEANGSQTAVVNVPTVFAPDEAVLLTCPKGVSFDREDLLVRHSSRWVKKLFDAATKASSAASSSSPGVVVPPATKDGGGTIRRLLERLNPVSYVPSTWTGSAVYLRVPTWRLRTELWSLWLCRPKKGGAAATAIDGPTACWLDNVILRQEPLLAPYWRLRASGRLDRAREYLSANMDGIAAAIEPATDVSEVCLLAARPADLLAMGSSGRDANAITRRAEECVVRSDFSATAMAGPMPNQLSVAFNDLGCWPEAPGGVSNCRRDLVNNHSTIRNHVLAECANEYGLPCFQVERNVQSIKLLPMWGLDGPRTANHGLVENLLQSQVDGKVAATTTAGPMGIETTFVPLLKTFVRAARKAGKGLTRKEMNEASRAMRRMAAYFECCDYNVTWNSTAVERAWTEAWLEDLSQPLSSLSQSLAPRVKRGKEIHATQTARNVSSHRDRNTLSALASPSTPSPSDFHIALHIFAAYFFIFSVALPPPGAPCPLVFQATHHGISSLFGAVMKHWRGTTFGIWDHAILWRETCLNISPAQQSAGPGGLGLAVQAMLLAGVGLATKLAYWEADVVVPCTSEFNPIWESQLGSDSARLLPPSLFRRRIDPIVNGITATVHSASPSASPGPDGTAKLRPGDPGTHPTALMLSHVVPIKDVRTAVLAAHLLTTRLGLPTYRLHVFGGLDRHPAYARQVARLITDLHLERNVILEGFTADAKRELRERAWVFVNSSLSEGLPLAIGEAALEGVPIVATEVGSTGLVLTDTEGGGGGGGTGEDATNPAASTDTSAGTGPRRYGEVVPPNDPMALAKAQLMVLAMVGPRWGPFCNEGREKAKAKADGCAADGDNGVILDPCAELPDTITPAHGEWLLKRMYERADDRRRLGQMSRQVVLKSFAGQRYLREHEQMYWVQWHIARMRVLAASAFRGEEVREDTSGEMILRRSFNGSVGSGGSSGGYSGTTSQSGITRFSGWSWGSQHRPMTPDDEESQRWQDFRSTTHSRRRLRKANRRQNRGAPADWMETDWTRTETNSMTQIS